MLGNLFSGLLNDLLPEKYLKAKLILKKVCKINCHISNYELSIIKLRIKKALSGVTSLEPRNLFCVGTAQTLLPDEVGKIYVSAFLGKEAKEEVIKETHLVTNFRLKLLITRSFKAIHMSSDILNQTLDIIKDADWMDTNSKAKALDKATNIKLQVGYPEFYDNLTYIESSKQVDLSIFEHVYNLKNNK